MIDSSLFDDSFENFDSFSCSPGKSWGIVVKLIPDDFSMSFLGCRKMVAGLSVLGQTAAVKVPCAEH